MSVNFYELIRYAKTGIASSDMSAYDKMRALAMAGGEKYPVATITGVPPISFLADGRPLSAWTITGNSRQDAPADPQFVGERTANLFDEVYTSISSNVRKLEIAVPNGDYTLSSTTPLNNNDGANLFLLKGNDSPSTSENGVWNEQPRTITISDGVLKIGYRSIQGVNPENYKTILNTGSTAKPYEPYGYKIDITCAGQTTPIYIGEPLRKAIDGSDAVDVLYSTGTITRAVDEDGNALETPTTQIIDVPPEIPTVRGSNVLTIDTTVQPSSVTITGHIKPV